MEVTDTSKRKNTHLFSFFSHPYKNRKHIAKVLYIKEMEE